MCPGVKRVKFVLGHKIPTHGKDRPDYAHGDYSQHFSWAFVLIHHMNVPSKFEVRRFTSS